MRAGRRGYSLVDVTVTGSLVAILLTVLLPGCYQNNYTPASTRSQCKNNLKQLGLALHNYHAVHLAFPPGWVAVRHPEGGPAPTTQGTFGWSTRILPFMDQGPLFDTLDFNDPQGPSAQQHQTSVAASVLATRCPDTTGPELAGSPQMATTTYVGNFGVGLPDVFAEGITDGDYTRSSHGLFRCNSRIRIRDMKDGTSNVVLVGERRLPENCGDWRPGQTSGALCSYWPGIRSVEEVSPLAIVGTATTGTIFGPSAIPGSGPLSPDVSIFGINQLENGTPLGDSGVVTAGFSSSHTGGINALLGDGAVRFLNETIAPSVLVNLARRSDGQVLGEF